MATDPEQRLREERAALRGGGSILGVGMGGLLKTMTNVSRWLQVPASQAVVSVTVLRDMTLVNRIGRQ